MPIVSSARRRPVLFAPMIVCAFAFGCGSGTRRFPLRDPLLVDNDTRSVRIPCRADKDDPNKVECVPKEYFSPIGWDAADNLFFRPISKGLSISTSGESVNVNALDEVPDSAWFENRIGVKPMTQKQMFFGPCKSFLDDHEWPEGSWVIDQGKSSGSSPGFRVKIEGVGKFMLKSDSKEQPERPSAASAIGMRLYHAAGFNAPCDAVIYFDPKVLKLLPGLESTSNTGRTTKFDEKALQDALDINVHSGKLVRMQSSEWLPGKGIGPFKYEGVRDDDPNDRIAHEDRRELRGGGVLAAWMNHFDLREQNSLNVWLQDDPADARSPGYVKHYYLDVSDSFGSEWTKDDLTRRFGHSYYLDWGHVTADLLTLGLIERPWQVAKKDPVGDIFGYFRVEDFVPDKWKPGYQNPAYARMTERDAAWMTRIIARITPELIVAAVAAGRFSHPQHEEYLIKVLNGRQRLILRRYFARLSPIADVKTNGHEVCAVDLARRSKAFPEVTFAYEATSFVGESYTPGAKIPVVAREDGSLCMQVGDVADGGAKDDDVSRYRIVDVTNGQAKGPLRMHFYDLGKAKGLKLVGLERPESTEPPR
ncbi:MAG: hypothetical protein ACXVEF_35470 [Polyangiales bacterium]